MKRNMKKAITVVLAIAFILTSLTVVICIGILGRTGNKTISESTNVFNYPALPGEETFVDTIFETTEELLQNEQTTAETLQSEETTIEITHPIETDEKNSEESISKEEEKPNGPTFEETTPETSPRRRRPKTC